VKDLGKQISHLLKVGLTSEERDVDVDVEIDVEGSDDTVVTFDNVDELQQRNSELLSLVREMTAERESAEIHKVPVLGARSFFRLVSLSTCHFVNLLFCRLANYQRPNVVV
jgi:hypothetical protein